jgi:hypothetical protein
VPTLRPAPSSGIGPSCFPSAHLHHDGPGISCGNGFAGTPNRSSNDWGWFRTKTSATAVNRCKISVPAGLLVVEGASATTGAEGERGYALGGHGDGEVIPGAMSPDRSQILRGAGDGSTRRRHPIGQHHTKRGR